MSTGFDLWAVVFLAFAAFTLINVFGYLITCLPDISCSSIEGEFPEEKTIPGASVVICARNEAENLIRHLPHILQQECAFPYEVIVVNDASSDATSAVLEKFSLQYAHLKAVHVRHKMHPGKKQALTLGVAAARYDLIALTDADCEVQTPHWLRRMAVAMCKKKEHEIVLGYGGYKTCGDTWLNAWVRYETVHTARTYLAWAVRGMPYMGVGRNLAWRKQLFERVGGLSSHMGISSGDDDLFINATSNSQNITVCVCKDAFTMSEPKHTWRAWWRQKRRHIQAGSSYRFLHRLMLSIWSLTHTLHYIGITLLLFSPLAWLASGIWALRILLLMWTWHRTLRSFGESSLWYRVPLLDIMMAGYWVLAGAYVFSPRLGSKEIW